MKKVMLYYNHKAKPNKKLFFGGNYYESQC